MGLSSASRGATRSRLPSSARARTSQSAAWVYWPPFSRTPGDGAGVGGVDTEGGGQKTNHPLRLGNQVLLGGRHGPFSPPWVGGAGEHGPGLHEGGDAALGALSRPQRRAVIVVAAPVPVAVPACRLQCRGKLAAMPPVSLGPRRVAL